MSLGIIKDGKFKSVCTNPTAEHSIYSTTEQNTGKTWIDGKPIYRIVVKDIPFPLHDNITGGPETLGRASTCTTNYNISDIDCITDAKYWAYEINDESHYVSIPHWWQSEKDGVPYIAELGASFDCQRDTGGCNQGLFETWSNNPGWNSDFAACMAILEYTKTTD